jgi:hypothetical protein
VSRHPDAHAFTLFDLLVSKGRFNGQFGIEKTPHMLAGLPFRLDSVLLATSFFVNELEPAAENRLHRSDVGQATQGLTSRISASKFPR